MRNSVVRSSLVIMLISGVGWAQVPSTIGNQGVLTVNSGVVVPDGTQALTFKLYNVATGGTAPWTEVHPSVSTTNGVFSLAARGSVWTAVSDSTLKRNIREVDGEDILHKLTQLPIKQWSYKSQDPGIEHIGPMAQDFYAVLVLGKVMRGFRRSTQTALPWPPSKDSTR